MPKRPRVSLRAVHIGSLATAAPDYAAPALSSACPRTAALARWRSHGVDRGIAAAILQFGIPGLIALVVVGLGAGLVFRDRGEREAIRDARQLTRAIGLGMVAPRLSDGILDGDRDAVDRLHAFVTGRVKPLVYTTYVPCRNN